MKRVSQLFTSAAWCLFALAAVSPLSAMSLQVKDIAATARTIPDTQTKATVLLFVTHDCPISNTYAPEFNRIRAQYTARKISFYVVYVERDISTTQVKQHAKAFGYACPILRDADHKISHALGASVTPTAVVLDPTGHVAYLGSIDNRYVGIGQTRTIITKHYLRDALDDILSAKPIARTNTPTYGCDIPA